MLTSELSSDVVQIARFLSSDKGRQSFGLFFSLHPAGHCLLSAAGSGGWPHGTELPNGGT